MSKCLITIFRLHFQQNKHHYLILRWGDNRSTLITEKRYTDQQDKDHYMIE